MTKQLPLVLILPAATVVVGAAILLFGFWDYRREADDVEQLFKAHVDSVALLVKEGAREASASTSLIYDITEENLLATARLLADSPPDTGSEPVIARVVVENGVPGGDFGPIPERARHRFIEWMRTGPEEVLVDDGPLRKLGLACILHSISPGKSTILCRDAEELSVLRREIGIGPLLKGVIKKDILYVALQDQEGILAVAPSPEHVSRWRDDPFLSASLESRRASGTSRLRYVGGHAVFEGLIPFVMADDSTVLLRVGIDAAPLERVRESAWQRFSVMVGLVLGIVLLSFLVAWMIRHWQLKQLEMDRLFEAEEEKRKHWETIGQMAATVAHEVRNPLNTIGMVSQRLKCEFDIPEGERPAFDEMLDIMTSESRRVGRVVTEFLDLGKPLHLERRSVPADAAVREALLPLMMRAEGEGKTITLESHGSDAISLDQERFRQVIANLVGNALDAVSEGGAVRVRALCSPMGLTVEVSDNGPGIAGDRLQEVMKPFVSDKSTGTGLGLPLVKRIAEAHGGTFTLTSTPGGGTVASVFVPAAAKTGRTTWF